MRGWGWEGARHPPLEKGQPLLQLSVGHHFIEVTGANNHEEGSRVSPGSSSVSVWFGDQDLIFSLQPVCVKFVKGGNTKSGVGDLVIEAGTDGVWGGGAQLLLGAGLLPVCT